MGKTNFKNSSHLYILFWTNLSRMLLRTLYDEYSNEPKLTEEKNSETYYS